MAAKFVLVTEISPISETESQSLAAAQKWAGFNKPAKALERAVFQKIDGPELMELSAFEQFEDLSTFFQNWRDSEDALRTMLNADWRRQVLVYVESVKPTDHALPQTPYVQMRHVEVRPPAHQDYLEWRNRTIYEVVRGAPQVETFLSYHSLISENPGVMFISGFSCDPSEYQPVFTSEKYKSIVQEAGNYITTKGLYTQIYKRVSP